MSMKRLLYPLLAMLLLPLFWTRAEQASEAAVGVRRTGCVQAYLYDNVGSYTNVRYLPNGKVKVTLTRDLFIPCFELTGYKDGWWKIVTCMDAEGVDNDSVDAICEKAEGGYIHYSCVAVETRNYGGQTVEFRADPDPRSKVVWKTKEVIMVRPIGVSLDGLWWKVRSEDGKHEGWVTTDQLCTNPLTNCC